MKALVVGLGSMGKRRVRNLQALGVREIAGFDKRGDRRAEAGDRYGIEVLGSADEGFDVFRPDVVVVSTSPESHMVVANAAVDRSIPCFIEASVVDAEGILALHERTKANPTIVAPSCTMRYFPGPKKVKELLARGAIGEPLNFNYQSGQYLPDWHPWEPIKDFYVSARETGGCREIVPFELTWLNDMFGEPTALACARAKLTSLDADIDDIYHCLLRYPKSVLGNLTVEVVSRPVATRELRILGTHGEIVFSADENVVRCATVQQPAWERFDLAVGSIEAGYINPEEPYIAELRDFVDAVRVGDKRIFPNTLVDDYRVLQTLHQLEALS
jgi:predicted dehydrogenase